ncbi:MAG: enoyl-CoA hydratase/isomerase family protein [Pseudomonadota bacterium]|jgi:enoyl-CoA hydratase
MYETITLETAEHIAWLTLNRPESRNALNQKMCKEITRACEEISSDPNVHVVVIQGAGPAFCAGADLKERQHMSVEEMLARRVEGFTAYAAIEALPMPVVAVVNGPAYGSGAEIAASCDFVIASERASFKYPEVGWGTVGATQRLPRIVGARMAKELLFTGRTVDAAEAKLLGLANQVFQAQELMEKARAIAAGIAKNNPITTRLTKRSIDNGLEGTRQGAMAIELLAIQENLRHSDWKKAIAGFGQKTEEAGRGA